MNQIIFSIIESLLFVIALSVDAFVACFAYGTNRIKIPIRSIVIIGFLCSAILAISLFAGNLVRQSIPETATSIICFLILFILGIIKLFDSSIKAVIRKRKSIDKKMSFSFFHLTFILNIYANPEQADCDCSRYLSSTEAVSLAIALSLDGLAAGFGAALAEINLLQVISLSFLFGILAIISGSAIGNLIAKKVQIDLSWISGVLLIILAFLKFS